MTEVFQVYLKGLYKDVPTDLYELLGYGLCLGLLLILTKHGLRVGWRNLFVLLLLEYVVLLFATTVFSRNCSEAPRFNFIPFWSYWEITNGRHHLIPEIIMNVIVFVPVGLLLGLAFNKMKWKWVLLFSLLLSASIEILQFVLHRGFSELDDIMHNTLGCLIGFGIYKAIGCIIDSFGQRRSGDGGTGTSSPDGELNGELNGDDRVNDSLSDVTEGQVPRHLENFVLNTNCTNYTNILTKTTKTPYQY